MKHRKTISVMLAICMLLTVLPMAAPRPLPQALRWLGPATLAINAQAIRVCRPSDVYGNVNCRVIVAPDTGKTSRLTAERLRRKTA